jgi:hypothetical protein
MKSPNGYAGETKATGKLNKPTSANPCQAHNRQGRPCGAYALAGSNYCWTHDPDLREQRRLARSRGGQARHRQHITWSDDTHGPSIHIRSVTDVLALLERALLHEVTLENSHARNACIGRLCLVALKALEVGALEERIAALEARAHAQH